MAVLDDKMRVALTGLESAQFLVKSGISELRAQGYTTEADNLQLDLDVLITDTDAAKAAVAA